MGGAAIVQGMMAIPVRAAKTVPTSFGHVSMRFVVSSVKGAGSKLGMVAAMLPRVAVALRRFGICSSMHPAPSLPFNFEHGIGPRDAGEDVRVLPLAAPKRLTIRDCLRMRDFGIYRQD